MIDWLPWLRDIPRKAPAALVHILASEGSTPRGAGARMLVTEDALHGAIGGGQLELKAVEQARALLKQARGSWQIHDYPLGPLLGQSCGGRVRLLIEHVDPAGLGWTGHAADGRVLVSTLTPGRIERHVDDHALPSPLSARGDKPREGASFAERLGQYRRPLYLFGAGHAGQAFAYHAAKLPFQLAWFDTRPVFETIEGVVIVPEAALEQCIAEAPADAAILILTHDQALDYRLARAALARQSIAYVGLEGSAEKRDLFDAHLERDGISAYGRSRLTMPVGMPSFLPAEPDVIAITTLAQLLQLDAS